MTRTLLAALVATASLFGSNAAPQTPNQSTGSVTGVVLAADTREPIAGAEVELRSRGAGEAAKALTDERGVFVFQSVVSGYFDLRAVRRGYLEVSYGSPSPGRLGVAVAVAGSAVERVELLLSKPATISGRVLTPTGDPVSGVGMAAFVVRGSDRKVVGGPIGISGTDLTGKYVFTSLPPDDYVLVAHGALGRFKNGGIGTPTFYPSAADLNTAGVVTVAAGDTRTSVDIFLVERQAVTISGRVVMPSGDPAELAIVEFNVPASPMLRAVLPAARPRPNREGTFEFTGLPPGRYEIAARAPRSPELWGRMEVVAFGTGATGLVVPLQQGATISGRVILPTGTSTPALDRAGILVRLMRAGTTEVISVEAVALNGAFIFRGVAPGSYGLTASLPTGTAGWSVESSIIGNRDVRDSGIDIRDARTISDAVITLTDHPTSLSGVVYDAKGIPRSAHYLAIIPQDRSLWFAGSERMRLERPSSDGRYVVTGLPPGQYVVIALATVDEGDWFAGIWPPMDLAAGLKFNLERGEQKVLSLKTAR